MKRWNPSSRRRHRRSSATSSAPPFLNDIEARVSYIARSGAFGPVTRELIKWEGRHDPVGLRRMFATFGAWISLPDELREQVLDDVERLARDDFGGVVRRPYQTVVYVAQRLARTSGIR